MVSGQHLYDSAGYVAGEVYHAHLMIVLNKNTSKPPVRIHAIIARGEKTNALTSSKFSLVYQSSATGMSPSRRLTGESAWTFAFFAPLALETVS